MYTAFVILVFISLFSRRHLAGIRYVDVGVEGLCLSIFHTVPHTVPESTRSSPHHWIGHTTLERNLCHALYVYGTALLAHRPPSIMDSDAIDTSSLCSVYQPLDVLQLELQNEPAFWESTMPKDDHTLTCVPLPHYYPPPLPPSFFVFHASLARAAHTGAS